MDGEKDNGYHSNDNELEVEDDDIENHILEDLQYDVDETALEEPDYDTVRKQRFQRNQNAMKRFNTRIANETSYLNESEMLPAEEKAAILIQKHVRRLLGQRKYIEMLMEQFEKEEKLRREKTMEQVEEAKLLIENHQLEVQFEDYNVIRRNKAQRLSYYVITIQRAWRKHLSARAEKNNSADSNTTSDDKEQNSEIENTVIYERLAMRIVNRAIDKAIVKFQS
uniref:uncharacterized protein LOC120328382 n=1 Tax=Styela clava TaxID=7725 RepID=UPI00193A26D1|nr:uncharacterized protein LOC120328382 [Styela clava]